MDDDINSRQAELDNLVKQKETEEIDRETEIERLETLESNVNREAEKIEAAYQALIA